MSRRERFRVFLLTIAMTPLVPGFVVPNQPPPGAKPAASVADGLNGQTARYAPSIADIEVRWGTRRRIGGAGFVIDSEGTVLTNSRVVERADEIRVGLADAARYRATLVGRDALTDLAVLKVSAPRAALHPLNLGRSAALRVGDPVIVFGAPRGPSDRLAVVSSIRLPGRHRPGMPPAFVDLMQVDKPLPPAYAGGPLLNADGSVVGMVTLLPTERPGYPADTGFAVPIEAVLEVLPMLVKAGKVVRGWLGLTVYPVGDDLVRSLNLVAGQGALVRTVVDDGPAARAGLKTGDVVLAVDERVLGQHGDLGAITALRVPGETLQLRVRRGETEHSIAARLGTMPDEVANAQPMINDPPPPLPAHGLLLQDRAPETSGRERMAGVGGVSVVEVEVGSPGDRSGLSPGDLIVGVGPEGVASVRQFEAALASASRPIQIKALRAGAVLSLDLPIDRK
jgi:serine protease Do